MGEISLTKIFLQISWRAPVGTFSHNNSLYVRFYHQACTFLKSCFRTFSPVGCWETDEEDIEEWERNIKMWQDYHLVSWWEAGNQFCIVITPGLDPIGWALITWSQSDTSLVIPSCILIGTLSFSDWSSLKTCQNWMKFKQSKINWAANLIPRLFCDP